MSEMVERVARALVLAFENGPCLNQNDAKALAWAAIRAMREPTDGMIIEIAAALVCWEEVTPGEVWDSVIDEALK